MGLYSNANLHRDASLFHALSGYLDLVVQGVKCDQISVPVQKNPLDLTEIMDTILSRDDKPLAGVRISVKPSDIKSKEHLVPLSAKEIEEQTVIVPADSVAERLRKATLKKERIVIEKVYIEAEWTIYLRIPDSKGVQVFHGTPFDDAEIERAIIAILEAVKVK